MLRPFLLLAVAVASTALTVRGAPTDVEELDFEHDELDDLSPAFTWWNVRSWGAGFGKKHGICDELDWRAESLKLIREIPVAGLFADLKGTSKWESSGVDMHNGKAYFIFDSLDFIGMTDPQLHFLNSDNTLIGEQGDGESSFEAIMYAKDSDTFLMIREAMPTARPDIWYPSVVEATVSGDRYEILQECIVNFHFPSDDKGLEGGAYFVGEKGERYLLGLCEGNWCEPNTMRGQDKGNGRALLTKFGSLDNGDCAWKVEKELIIPPEAKFEDYADIAIYDEHIAIVSQVESAVWIGVLDRKLWEIKGPGVVYNFPRDSQCRKVYCNIEGITFLDTYRLLTTSDKAKHTKQSDKKKGKKWQPWRCVAKDQAMQVFLLPEPLNQTSFSSEQ